MILRRRMERTLFQFQPFSKKQVKVLTWWCPSSPVKDARGIIADGSIRSGKTLSMSLSFLIWAMENFSGQNFALCGKTIGTFRRNVLDLMKRMAASLNYQLEEFRTDNLLLVSGSGRTNRFYLFGGKDEGSQDLIQGLTLAGVLFDEAALMPQSFVAQAMARCSVDGAKYWFDCNPENPGHWFYTEWIQKRDDKGLLYLHFNMRDNLTLSEEKIEEYESMYTGVFYDRYILGRWVKAEGLIYAMFGDSCKTAERPKGQYYVSIDYGTMNPFSAGLWSVYGGVATRVQECYYNSRKTGSQKTDEEYYTMLEDLIDGRAVQYIVVDPSAASFIECIRRHGRYSVRKAANDVLDGIRVVSSMLKSGKVKIHESCINAIEEFGLYSWDEKSGDDRVLKENDHAMDDIRYFCNTVLVREFRWDRW